MKNQQLIFVKIQDHFANVAKFCQISKCQLDNLVDVEKCRKTRICLHRSAPIQPKTSESLLKICRKLATVRERRRHWPVVGNFRRYLQVRGPGPPCSVELSRAFRASQVFVFSVSNFPIGSRSYFASVFYRACHGVSSCSARFIFSIIN